MEREVNERLHVDPDSEQQPELTYSHDDTRPNAAWNFANKRTRGWGVWSEGSWLESLDDFGPHYTPDNGKAQCFNTNEGAKRLGMLLVRYLAHNNIQRRVYVHLIPAGGR